MEVDRCRDLRPHFPAFVTDGGDATVQARIREHLSLGCAACAAEIGRLDAAFYSLPASLPPQPVLEGGTDAMVAALARRPQEQPETPILFPDGRPLRVAWTVAFLMALALAAAAVWGRGQQDAVRSATLSGAADARQVRQVVQEYRQLQEAHDGARAMLEQLTDPATQVVSLTGAASTSRAFVALDAGTLLFTTTGLPAEPAWTLVLVAGDDVLELGPLEPRIAESGGGRQYPLPEGLALPQELQLRAGDGRVVLRGTVEAP